VGCVSWRWRVLSGIGFGDLLQLSGAGDHDWGCGHCSSRGSPTRRSSFPWPAAGGWLRCLTGRILGLAILAGILDAVPTLFFLLASRHGLLSLASVITSLYPAMTVLLAVMLLREHTGRLQRVRSRDGGPSIVLDHLLSGGRVAQ